LPRKSTDNQSIYLIHNHPLVEYAHLQVPRIRFRKPIVHEVLDSCEKVFTGNNNGSVTKRDNILIVDPLFPEQWHLRNSLSPGNDLNVLPVWEMGITGVGVTSAMIDDGVDFEHEDIRENFNFDASYDFNQKSNVPLPRLFEDYHGTRCAGQIAAVRNNVCGIGVAWGSKVSGLRILGGPITDVEEAKALNYEMDKNHIFSCSWGPADDGRHVEGPNAIVTAAILNGIHNGRNGKGNIFVFASGNGGHSGDNCNYDGYTNSIYTITIGAINEFNRHPEYSEECSGIMAVTYSSGGRSIVTTDAQIKGQPCTRSHGGTSAAAPLAVGVLALVLSVRPDLTWRDVQGVTRISTVQISSDDPSWFSTSSGLKYSHKFGYGSLDSLKAVNNAKKWKLLNEQAQFRTDRIHIDSDVLDGSYLISSVFISANNISNIASVEHITVTVSISHTRRGDLAIFLISPNGIASQLGSARVVDTSGDGFKDWTFMTVIHWGENCVGEWVLKVVDTVPNGFKGKLESWYLTIFGEKVASTSPTTTIISDVSQSFSSSSHTPSTTSPSTTSPSTTSPSTTPSSSIITSTAILHVTSSDHLAKLGQPIIQTTNAVTSTINYKLIITTNTSWWKPPSNHIEQTEGPNFKSVAFYGIISFFVVLLFLKIPRLRNVLRHGRNYDRIDQETISVIPLASLEEGMRSRNRTNVSP
jgi:kexin